MHREKSATRTDLLPGTLNLLILQTLRHGPMHGYAIAKHIQEHSKNTLQVLEGSLYPALQRLLRNGWVTDEWVPAEPKRRARVYRLTTAGRKQIEEQAPELARVMEAVLRLIQPA